MIEFSHPDADTALGLLVAAGVCDGVAAARARAGAREAGIDPVQALVKLGLVPERDLAQGWCSVLGLDLVREEDYPAEPVLAEHLQPRFLRASHVLPLRLLPAEEEGRVPLLLLAMANPFDRFAATAIGLATGHAVRAAVAVPIELEAALARLYPDEEAEPPEGAGEAAGSEDDTERLKDLASEAPVVRLVSQLIARAVESMASDIHIEPFEDRLRIRYRYDGDLQEAETHPARLAPAIISRLKILAKLDIAERRLPQDGRIRIAVRGQEVVFRVATAPSLHGEILVLRVLDRSAVSFDFAAQGHDAQVIARMKAALAAPNGIVLVTGPTGSGKTTTLYTALLSLNTVESKIITVEDPIEYQLPGISQMQVKPQINLGFAALLRSIVRLDPDIIMVGEIRDLETAEIAARAASLDEQLAANGLDLDTYLASQSETLDDHQAHVKADVERDLRTQFILDAIVAKEELVLQEAELTEYIVRRASRVGVTPDAYADQLVRSGTVPLAVADVLRGKALAFVLEHAVVTDASGRSVDLNQLERDAADEG